MPLTITADADTKQDSKKFERVVRKILNDPRSWKCDYSKRNIIVRLSTPDTIAKICGFRGLSCAIGKNTILIHLGNWLKGTVASGYSVAEYRCYVINHEMGHLLGLNHEKPVGRGKCPVMVQQTLGIGSQQPNPWPLPREIRAVIAKNKK